MRAVLSVAETRERESGFNESTLIQRAAAAVAGTALQMLGGAYGQDVTVLAGSGHNGADALRAGALLARRGARVHIVLSSTREGDAQVSAAMAEALSAGARVVSDVPLSNLVIDGMVGIGARDEPLSGRVLELTHRVLQSTVLAVDIPSGINADTGAVLGAAVEAEVTVTFGSLKPGLLLGSGAVHSGEVVVAPIGLGLSHSDAYRASVHACDVNEVRAHVPSPDREDDKRSRGVVGVIAGSEPYPGAGILSVGGAVRSGAGYVRAPGAPREVLAAFPSAVAADGNADVWVMGPGVDDSRRAEIEKHFAGDGVVLLDASALDLIGAHAIRNRSATTIITPHAREFERLTGVDPAGDPLGAARKAASELGAIVVLKGSTTIVATPDATTHLVLTPTPWLATAGTGDVLSGVIGTFVASALKSDSDVASAVAAAVFVHGLAGRCAADRGNGEAAIAADDLLASLGRAAASIRSVS